MPNRKRTLREQFPSRPPCGPLLCDGCDLPILGDAAFDDDRDRVLCDGCDDSAMPIGNAQWTDPDWDDDPELAAEFAAWDWLIVNYPAVAERIAEPDFFIPGGPKAFGG